MAAVSATRCALVSLIVDRRLGRMARWLSGPRLERGAHKHGRETNGEPPLRAAFHPPDRWATLCKQRSRDTQSGCQGRPDGNAYIVRKLDRRCAEVWPW